MKPAYFTALLAATLTASPAFAWTADETQRARKGEVVVHEVTVADGAAVEAIFYVAAPPAAAIGVLWDHEKFPQFMPNAKTSRVLERHANDIVLEQVGGQGPVNVTLVTKRHRAGNHIDWTLVRGDVARNDGSWDAAAAPGGTMLTYKVHVVPKGPVPARVTSFLQKQALPSMCKAVRERVEAVSRKP
ncbi:MAG: cyclase/dehydrase [Cyanobacteria bacterium RYN_339]|nr:cyclase/dehydrase [Cyanobacteria bacterium RYN_339]